MNRRSRRSNQTSLAVLLFRRKRQEAYVVTAPTGMLDFRPCCRTKYSERVALAAAGDKARLSAADGGLRTMGGRMWARSI